MRRCIQYLIQNKVPTKAGGEDLRWFIGKAKLNLMTAYAWTPEIEEDTDRPLRSEEKFEEIMKNIYENITYMTKMAEDIKELPWKEMDTVQVDLQEVDTKTGYEKTTRLPAFEFFANGFPRVALAIPGKS